MPASLSFDRILKLLLGLALASFSAYTLYGLWLGYSFWNDEVFSVAAAALPQGEAMQGYLRDVHPPLYQWLLALWVKLFGTSELSARLFSALFVAGALAALASLRRKMPQRVVLLTLFLFLSSWLTTYYAQEARSYAMLLFASALSFVLFTLGERRWLIAALLTLGCTHFFGTLQAMLYLLWIGLERDTGWPKRILLASVAGVLMIWPVAMLTLGGVGEQVGGKFWIDSTPLDALQDAIQAGIPLGSAGLILIFAAAWLRSSIPTLERRAAQDAAILFAAMAIGTALLNFHTPVTTERNFIVLLPPGSFLLAVALDAILPRVPRNWARIVLLVLIFLATQERIYSKIGRKFEPLENIRGATKGALAALDPVHGRLFAWPLRAQATIFGSERINFYFPPTAQPRVLDPQAIPALHAGDIVVFLRITATNAKAAPCDNALFVHLEASGTPFRATFPPQSVRCETGFVTILGP
ncbi:glycosyltransferase family 39 protein [Sedimentimonas flavescens]|uniref:glycosyltransferase family 39 protein n=1 Tax=Sedimentimonas flavescens TaxID=2851012 RepID=UPI0021A6A953|nr:glycosyltransferase family 39 protein [Sedimentimonas flavescens]MCT2539528.1 glycosyltransferase family 39 protein [Sedimentimonas flavescens]